MNFTELCSKADTYINEHSQILLGEETEIEAIQQYIENLEDTDSTKIVEYSKYGIQLIAYLFSSIQTKILNSDYLGTKELDERNTILDKISVYNSFESDASSGFDEVAPGFLEMMTYFKELKLPDFLTDEDKKILFDLQDYLYKTDFGRYHACKITLYDIFDFIENETGTPTTYYVRSNNIGGIDEIVNHLQRVVREDYILCDKATYNALGVIYNETTCWFYNLPDFGVLKISATLKEYISIRKFLNTLGSRKGVITYNFNLDCIFVGTKEEIATFNDLLEKKQILIQDYYSLITPTYLKEENLLEIDTETLEDAIMGEEFLSAIEGDSYGKEKVVERIMSIREFIQKSFRMPDSDAYKRNYAKSYDKEGYYKLYLPYQRDVCSSSVKTIKTKMEVYDIDFYISGYFIGENRLLLLGNKGVYELLPDSNEIELLFSFRTTKDDEDTFINPLIVEYNGEGTHRNLTDTTTLDNGSSEEKGMWFLPLQIREEYDSVEDTSRQKYVKRLVLKYQVPNEDKLKRIQQETKKLMLQPTYDRAEWLDYALYNLLSLDEMCLKDVPLPSCLSREFLESRKNNFTGKFIRKEMRELIENCTAIK